jgi:hypothetical protein
MTTTTDDLLARLDEDVPFLHAAWVFPDWSEDDPRWPLVDAQMRRLCRRAALEIYHERVEAAFHEQIRDVVRSGVPRPQVAHALRMSLRDLKAILGES